MVKNMPTNAGDKGDMGSIPGSGRSPGVGNGNALQYSCLEKSMDRGAWRTTIHKITNNQKQLYTHTYTYIQLILYVIVYTFCVCVCVCVCSPLVAQTVKN